LIKLVIFGKADQKRFTWIRGQREQDEIGKDPFDRMLIAQRITENDPIMTEAPKIAVCGCRLI